MTSPVRILALAGILASIISMAAAAQPTPAGRSERVRTDVRSILSEPEFRVEPVGDSLLARIGRQFGDYVDRFIKWFRGLFRFSMPGAAGGGNAIFWVLLAMLVVGMAFLLAYVLKKWDRTPKARAREKTLSVEVDGEEEMSTDPEEWLRRARRHASDGDFRTAYRAAFVALLLQLDLAGFARFDRARTNGEYLRALRARPNVLGIFRPLANDFDSRWYGGRAVSEWDYNSFVAAHAHLKGLGS